MTAKYNLAKMFLIIAVLAMIFSSIQPPAAQAQGGDGLQRQVNAESGRVSFISPASGRSLSAARALGQQAIRSQDPAMALANRYAPEFGLRDAERSLTAMESNRSEAGHITARFQQNYQDVPVMGGELIVNTNDGGDLYSISGEVSPDVSLSTQPTIDAEQARKTALSAVAKWYGKTPEDFTATEPELWIYDESLLQPSTRPVELTWRMEVMAKDAGLPMRELVLVNAQRGSISLHFNQVDTAWTTNKPADDLSTPTPEPPQPMETPSPTNVPVFVSTPSPEADSQTNGTGSASTTVELAASLTGTPRYVATIGNDSNSCTTPDSPCATINGALVKAAAGDSILVTEGIYTASGEQVVYITKNVTILGGWDTAFTSQHGFSVINGQDARYGVLINPSVTAILERLTVERGLRYGIFSNGFVTVTKSFIQNNSGTGIYVGPSGTLTLDTSTVSGNRGDSGIYTGAGGIDADGTSTINNSTITNNTAGRTGAIYSYYSSNIAINNSTIARNSGTEAGGIYTSGTVSLRNTIVSGNTSTSGNFPDCAGSTKSLGNNIIGNTKNCGVIATTGDKFNVEPVLGTFLPKQGYLPLLPGSPAINAGNAPSCPSTDQRGAARVGTCDIGAYEYTPPGTGTQLFIFDGNLQRALPISQFGRRLKIAALDSLGSPVPGVQVKFNAPAIGASGIFADTGVASTTAFTDASGIATASSFTASDQFGAYEVVGSAAGFPPLLLSLENGGWFVSPSGNDSKSCSMPSSPCLSINTALGKARAEDTILVAEGLYTGSGNSVVAILKSINLLGGWDASFSTQTGYSTIDGQNTRPGIAVISAPLVKISHFVIKQGKSTNGSGGGISVLKSTASLDHMLIFDNVGSNGGGISSDQSNLAIEKSMISGNKAASGGGISSLNYSTVTIDDSSIHSNESSGEGGGISGRNFTINNTTISRNTAALAGGGISTGSGSFLNNVTITENHAGTQGGGLLFNEIYLSNSIIANNTAQNVIPVDTSNCSAGSMHIDGKTIFYPSDCLHIGPQSPVIVQPKLGAFIPALGYQPLKAGSPAIDAGNLAACTITDQRGVARPVGGGCDVGAYEYIAPGALSALLILEGNDQQASLMHYFNKRLKVLGVDSLGSPVPNLDLTFTAPGDGASANFDDSHANTSSNVSDANGIGEASALKANDREGTYSVLVSANGSGLQEVFSISNTSAVLGPTILTYNASSSPTLPGQFVCSGNVASCTNGSNPRADGAHQYALGTYNFYDAKYARDSIDNKNMTIVSSINYCNQDPYNCLYANAFWDGEQMVYGNAYGYSQADDIVAHELTHGVTQYESNLFYYYQSGAINESFSDLWGEYYDQVNGSGNDSPAVGWIIGEDISGYPIPSGFSFPAMRSMVNPPALGDPDMMTSSKYYKGEDDNGGVHHNSGINNKAVYLMVNGGTFNTKTVNPLGWNKVGAIYYEVNTNLLTSGADYSDLYYALQLACANLIGKNGIIAADCIEVKDAIDAVQMYAQPATNFNPEATLCSTNTPVIAFADDLENGAGKWTFENIGAAYGWQFDSPYGQYAQSGQHFLYADDYPQGQTNAWAKLASFVVPNNAYLWFAQAYDFETGYNYNDPTLYNFDGGVLEYSLDGGMNWVDAGSLIEQNGYKGKISGNYSNWLYGRSGFVGSSHGYISTRVNLAKLAGKTVSFRWWMGLDSSGSAWGWWVDNIKMYTCGKSATFADVPATHLFFDDIQILYANGLTGGCSTAPLKFCPDQIMDRAQASVFMVRGAYGAGYVPNPSANLFQDNWTPGLWARPWAEAMRETTLTTGCSLTPWLYCPWTKLPREQVVIFGLKMKYGNGYLPPAATGAVFADLTDPNYYATAWAEKAYADGLITNCGMSNGKPKFCPNVLVTRGLGAYVIVRAKNLTMP